MTWLVRLKLAALVLTTVVLQTTLFPDLRLFGVAPDLVLVATIAVAYRVGPETGAVYGFASGLVIDLFLQTPLGLSALSFAVVAYGIGILHTGLSRTPRFIAAMLGGAGGLAGGLIFVVLAALAGEDQVIAFRTIWVLVLAAVYDALLAVPMFPVARWAVGSTGAETPAIRGARST
ncbi:MAG: rod shape-determining protein MreD [Acidimicrobiia bacterium]